MWTYLHKHFYIFKLKKKVIDGISECIQYNITFENGYILTKTV